MGFIRLLSCFFGGGHRISLPVTYPDGKRYGYCHGCSAFRQVRR